MEWLDEAAMTKIFQAAVDRAGGQTSFALRRKISVAYASDMYRAKKPVSARIARMLGYRRQTIYRPRSPNER